MSILGTPNGERAQKALRESEKRLRAIWDAAVEGIVTIDERGSIESLNPAACRIFGYSPAEVVGQNVSILMPSPDREKHDSYLENYLRTGQAKIIGIGREVVGQRKDGSLFPMDLSVSEVSLSDRRLFTGLVRDITERRHLEQAVAAAAEQERARIARDLHDGLGQQLGGLLYLMDGLHRDLKMAGAQHAQAAAQLLQELTTALSQARTLAHELHAVPPEPEGLIQALESLAERVVTSRDIECRFGNETPVLVHNQAVASHLYRIAQEAVHNALKHSRATEVTIELTRLGSGIELSVRDNGTGFPTQAASRGIGLKTMQQRAKLIGAVLIARTHTKGGVEVVCSVPGASLERIDAAKRIESTSRLETEE